MASLLLSGGRRRGQSIVWQLSRAAASNKPFFPPVGTVPAHSEVGKYKRPAFVPTFHVLPGGPQNANVPRLFRANLKAFLTRIKRVGFIRTMRELNMSHEINWGETLGTLRGVDEFGNRYYENLDNQHGMPCAHHMCPLLVCVCQGGIGG